MIKPREIQRKASAVSVRDQQIEKDYILSWIIQGISQNKLLVKSIIFKGGTVLKKVYFADYRFSEDLDFTLLNYKLPNEQIFSLFEDVFEYVREIANIPLEIIERTEHEDGGINFYISYVGPLGGRGKHKHVKVDISRSECLEFEPITQSPMLIYSDQEKHQLLCYPLEEILVEKLRSVLQRMEARDFYDIWYLLEIHGMEINFYIKEFTAKCECKGLDPKQLLEKLEQRKASYKGRWKKSLSDQIKNLPDYDKVEREVQRYIRKLNL